MQKNLISLITVGTALVCPLFIRGPVRFGDKCHIVCDSRAAPPAQHRSPWPDRTAQKVYDMTGEPPSAQCLDARNESHNLRRAPEAAPTCSSAGRTPRCDIFSALVSANVCTATHAHGESPRNRLQVWTSLFVQWCPHNVAG